MTEKLLRKLKSLQELAAYQKEILDAMVEGTRGFRSAAGRYEATLLDIRLVEQALGHNKVETSGE